MAREEIIGRKREIALLDSYMATVKPEFVALYGRRRIGKTFLVKKLYEESFDFYVTGIFDKSKKEQLANEKDVRYEEIKLASKHLNDLIQKYIDDYGSFSFSRSYSDDKNNCFPYCYHWLF